MVLGQGFCPDGTLYGVVPSEKKIVAVSPQGRSRTVAEGIAAHGIVVTHDGTIYVSEPGAHSDMPSRVWQILGGGKKEADRGLIAASRSEEHTSELQSLRHPVCRLPLEIKKPATHMRPGMLLMDTDHLDLVFKLRP